MRWQRHSISVYFDHLTFDIVLHPELSTIWHLCPTTPWYAPVVAIKAMLRFSPFTFSTTHNVIDLTTLLLFVTLLALCFVGPERFAVSQWSMPLFGILALSLLDCLACLTT